MDDITKAILDNYDTQIESSEVVLKYFIEKKRKYMEKNNLIINEKEGMSMDEFAKTLANIWGHESFDDMTDDEKYVALTIWRDHIRSKLEG